jgi:hypothetical protein
MRFHCYALQLLQSKDSVLSIIPKLPLKNPRYQRKKEGKEEMRRILERNKCREETRKEMKKRRNKGQRNRIELG